MQYNFVPYHHNKYYTIIDLTRQQQCRVNKSDGVFVVAILTYVRGFCYLISVSFRSDVSFSTSLENVLRATNFNGKRNLFRRYR